MPTVTEAKQIALVKKMRSLGIYERDLEEKFIRSGGPGGQHVNKTSTCVQLTHIPSGIKIKCQKSRSQVLNRFLARRLLLEKIETIQHGKLSEKRKQIDKIRRQKRRRSRRAKEKMLKEKKKRSLIKEGRSFRVQNKEIDG